MMPNRSPRSSRRVTAELALAIAVTAALAGGHVSSALASAPAPAWTVKLVSGPTNFTPGESTGEDVYLVRATNSGGAPTAQGEPITLTDTLPAELTLDPAPTSGNARFRGKDDAGNGGAKKKLTCLPGPPVTCTDPQDQRPLQPGESLWMEIPVDVGAGTPSSVLNAVSVSGGGAPSASASLPTTVSATPASFGFPAGTQGFDGAVSAPDGSTVTQAGSHPYQATLSFAFNNVQAHGHDAAAGEAKTVTANLPPGLIVDPNATPAKCTEAQLETDAEEASGGGCPASSQVGTVLIVAGQFGTPGTQTARLYNMVAPPGSPAELGFDAVGAGLYVHLRGLVRTGGDYGLSATSSDILQEGQLFAFSATLWGDPSDPSHDAVRGHCFKAGKNESGELCPTEPTGTPLLTLPTSCSGPLATSIEAESWQEPGNFIRDSFLSHDNAMPPNLVGVTGCSALDFSPRINVKPEPEGAPAESASGLNVDLRIPQEESLNGLAEAHLKDAVVTLPPGMTINPSAANGLQACSSAEIDLHGPAAANCPDASKIGVVEVLTPLLDHPLPGSVYLARPYENPFGSGEHPGGSLLAIYVAVHDPATGVVVKLPGHVEADASTGQLTATFSEAPQLPFSDFKLRLFGGPRAPLITPSGCGQYQAKASLTPWSGAPAATPSDTFGVSTGCASAFSPSFSAGTLSDQAGGFSPFSMTLSRKDGEQRLASVQVRMPSGLLAKIAGIPQCPEAQANGGTCSVASQIGTATVGAGAGPDQFYVPEAGQPANPVYLTGPYKGAPFGLSIVTHALAGPFDLGNVVVRAAINVDPHTAQLTVTSDSLPTILQGIALDVRTINVTVDRPGFMFNPTSCQPLTVDGTIASTASASAAVSSPFQAANCATLPFKPLLTATTQARTSKANGASLDVKVSQRAGEANIRKVDVSLPLALPSRLTTLQKACPEAQFAADPAGCPPSSDVGTATARTPALNVPLRGPAYLVSHGGAAFPDLDILLQGEGITIDLVGNTDIKKGITYSRFQTVPDAPIDSFELSLPEGPSSLLAAYGSLCAPARLVTVHRRVTARRHGRTLHLVRSVRQRVAEPLLMPTAITGQNGAQLTQATRIAVIGCAKAGKAKGKPRRPAGVKHLSRKKGRK